MGKIKIMGFPKPPFTIPFDDPHPKFHPVYNIRCVKDVEIFTWKRLTQFIGKKKTVLKNLRGLQQLPFGGRGLRL